MGWETVIYPRLMGFHKTRGASVCLVWCMLTARPFVLSGRTCTWTCHECFSATMPLLLLTLSHAPVSPRLMTSGRPRSVRGLGQVRGHGRLRDVRGCAGWGGRLPGEPSGGDSHRHGWSRQVCTPLSLRSAELSTSPISA